MKIDRMSSADLGKVVELADQLGYKVTVNEAKERLGRISRESSYALFVSKSDAGEILGWIQVNAEPASLLVDATAEIAALVVDQKARSQGIGKALAKQAEDWALENGFSRLRVRSNTKRTDAHRFYLREGFELSKTSNFFSKSLPQKLD